MEKTVFQISKMDCSSEESLIRMKLDEIAAVKRLEFDIPNRLLTVFHTGGLEKIEQSVLALNLDSKRLQTERADLSTVQEQTLQRKLLWSVLGINFSFFVIEMITGLISQSMGLVADSLDMLADSFVYGMSLWAVGGFLSRKKRISRVAGYFQVFLAIIGFAEVVRRFMGVAEMPAFQTMIIVSFLALMANTLCLYLLLRSGSKEAHMRASMIFTSNDVIINMGVMVAGILVLCLQSNIPDLIVGAIVFAVVLQGAVRILKLGK